MRLVEPLTQIKAGNRVILACTAFNSNPEPQISWYKNSYILSFDKNDSQRNITWLKTSMNDFETTSYVTVSDFKSIIGFLKSFFFVVEIIVYCNIV